LGSPLRRLWDFADLAGTGRRFQEELQRQASDDGRAEVLTQLARVAGLEGDLTAAERLLDEAEALAAFERALRARERDRARPAEVEVARYAVGRTLRALGRPGEAAALLEQAVAWASAAGQPDGWFHEELAEDYAALGRHADARRQARLALPLLAAAEPSFGGDAARVARLQALAGASGQGRPP
jgi:tetratricopeptide (TPR) repeat protein